MAPTWHLDFRKNFQQEPKHGGFALIKPEDELEYELEYEDMMKSKLMQSKRYYAFQKQMSRNVINEI